MFVLISKRVGEKLSNEDSCKLLQRIVRLDSNETVELWLSQPISKEYKKIQSWQGYTLSNVNG